MNKIVLAVVAVVILGGGLYLMLSSESDEAMNTNTTAMENSAENTESQDEVAMSGTGPLSAFMESGRSVQCEFSSEDESGSADGTFRYSNEQYRVDVDTVYEEGTYQSHIISDGENMYIWGTGPQGDMAIMMSEEDTEADESAEAFVESEETFDAEQNVTYDCQAWSADSSAFVPPSDIEFMDMSVMMQQMMEQMPEGFSPPQQ